MNLEGANSSIWTQIEPLQGHVKGLLVSMVEKGEIGTLLTQRVMDMKYLFSLVSILD